MKYLKLFILTLFLIVSTIAIWSFKKQDVLEKTVVSSTVNTKKDGLFNAYWYAGKAEIKTYDLTQSRYGELHKGMATVIFVTEPFLEKEGVKPDSHEGNQIPVLKMNLLKKFGNGQILLLTDATFICPVFKVSRQNEAQGGSETEKSTPHRFSSYKTISPNLEEMIYYYVDLSLSKPIS